MSLLKDIVIEMGAGCGGGAGATGATAVAGFQGSLFGGGRKKKKTAMIKRTTEGTFINYSRLINRAGKLNSGGILNLNKIRQEGQSQLQYAMSLISEDITGATDFDAADVISKLESAEKKAKLDKDTVTFGLENQDGGIVRVYVRKDQSEEFEQALSQMLAGSDQNKDNENDSMEIAEVLFKLKDRYDIVDVDWGDSIEEDEEQEQTVGGEQGQEGQPGQEGQEGGENAIDQAAGDEQGQEGQEGQPGAEQGAEAGGGEDQAKSALDAVIDMMKADAKAKQAEADARAAEARAKEAEWTAKATASKVKQEEEVLDMETHEKEIQKQEKEAKRLAKLAKYRHDKAAKYSGELHGAPDATAGDVDSEEEEQGGNHVPYDDKEQYQGAPDKSRVSLEQLRDMIFYHLRGETT